MVLIPPVTYYPGVNQMTDVRKCWVGKADDEQDFHRDAWLMTNPDVVPKDDFRKDANPPLADDLHRQVLPRMVPNPKTDPSPRMVPMSKTDPMPKMVPNSTPSSMNTMDHRILRSIPMDRH